MSTRPVLQGVEDAVLHIGHEGPRGHLAYLTSEAARHRRAFTGTGKG